MFKGNLTISVTRKAFLPALLLITLEFFVAAGAEAQSTAGLKLIGTINSASFSGAVFSDNAGLQSFFRINAPLPDGSRIVQVSSKSILLKNPDSTQYELFISQDLRTAGQTVPPPMNSEPAKQEEVAPGTMKQEETAPRMRRRAPRTSSRENRVNTVPDE